MDHHYRQDTDFNVWKKAIINNDAGLIQVKPDNYGEPPNKEESLKILVDNLGGRKVESKRKFNEFSSHYLEEMMTHEGHNITVFHRMIKNVFIRWDADYDHKAHCFSISDLNEKEKEGEFHAPKSKRF